MVVFPFCFTDWRRKRIKEKGKSVINLDQQLSKVETLKIELKVLFMMKITMKLINKLEHIDIRGDVQHG